MSDTFTDDGAEVFINIPEDDGTFDPLRQRPTVAVRVTRQDGREFRGWLPVQNREHAMQLYPGIAQRLKQEAGIL